MTDKQPVATYGREPTARVGNFECVCGKTVIKSAQDDEVVTVSVVEYDHGWPNRRLTCYGCGREWWLQGERPVWEHD